jgi:hypothetical protein
MKKTTDKIELVETHNLALSLRRLKNIPDSWNQEAVRRALYHAVCMTGCFDLSEQTQIREAIKLP